MGLFSRKQTKNHNDPDSGGWLVVGGQKNSRVPNKGKNHAKSEKLGVRIRATKIPEHPRHAWIPATHVTRSMEAKTNPQTGPMVGSFGPVNIMGTMKVITGGRIMKRNIIEGSVKKTTPPKRVKKSRRANIASHVASALSIVTCQVLEVQ